LSRRVLVTGSSRGIGKSIALQLADDGFDILVHCVKGVASAEAVAQEIISKGRKAEILQFDIANREEAAAKIEAEIEANGAIYGVVCNAGITADNAFPAIPSEDWDAVIDTNLNGFYNVVHPLVMPMIRSRKGGRIIAMSSVSGIGGNRGQVNYSASKAGLIGACKALAVELASRKITVNCVAPGLIDTDMISETEVEHALPMIPAKRMGHVDEVAGAVSYLMSDIASYTTRQVLSVNGGMI